MDFTTQWLILVEYIFTEIYVGPFPTCDSSLKSLGSWKCVHFGKHRNNFWWIELVLRSSRLQTTDWLFGRFVCLLSFKKSSIVNNDSLCCYWPIFLHRTKKVTADLCCNDRISRCNAQCQIVNIFYMLQQHITSTYRKIRKYDLSICRFIVLL